MRRITMVIICGICALLGANAGATVAYGNLTGASPTFDRPDEGAPPTSLSGNVVPYQVFPVTHSGGYLIVAMRGVDSGGGSVADPYVVLYSSAGFDPGNPLTNVLWSNDDLGAGVDAAVAADVPAGSYIAVATGYEAADALGSFQLIWVSVNPADATIIPGEITSDDPTFERSDSGPSCNPSGVYPHYDVYTVTHTGGLFGVTVAGHGTMPSGLTLADGFLEIHQGGTFNPASPCQGFVDADDDSLFENDPGYIGILPAGQYDIVVCGYDETELGTYAVSYSSMDVGAGLGLAMVPALDTWGLLSLATLLALAGILFVRSRMS